MLRLVAALRIDCGGKRGGHSSDRGEVCGQAEMVAVEALTKFGVSLEASEWGLSAADL